MKVKKPSLILFALAVVLSHSVGSQPVLVKDIHPGQNPAAGSAPLVVATTATTAFFIANTEQYGAELWKTDGTEAGTMLVKDITPGIRSSDFGDLFYSYDVNAKHFKNFLLAGTQLFFTVSDGIHGLELWKTDGTDAGTVMVKDINPGYSAVDWSPAIGDEGMINGSMPWNFSELNGLLYFSADDGVHGRELWKSDGTADGTVMVADAFPGDGSGIRILSPAGRVLGGNLYYEANDGIHGFELWKTNGSAPGTMMLMDVNATGDGSPGNFALTDHLLFFVSDDGEHGRELWKTDGTAPVLVKDITAGNTATSVFSELIRAGDAIYFLGTNGSVSGQGLWRSDGTEVGTFLIRASSISDGHIGMAGNTIYFSYYVNIDEYHLWKSDGTAAGTTLLTTDIRGITRMTDFNGTLYFSASGPDAASWELWKSDGTVAGTVRVKDINPGNYPSWPNLTYLNDNIFYTVNNRLIFSALNRDYGKELWVSDGTDAGTTIVKDFKGNNSGLPMQGITIGRTYFFIANDGVHGAELWKSDGTETGTVLVKDINPGGSIDMQIKNLQPTSVGNMLYFIAYDGVHGSELWKSDGTETGTILVKDIRPGSNTSVPGNLVNVNGTLFFRALGKVWKTDGTEAGTVQVGNVTSGGYFVANNSLLYFVGYDAAHGYELWKSDGTDAGTVIVKDIRPGPASAVSSQSSSNQPSIPFIDFSGNLYFMADDGAHGLELWKTDGTEGGTVMVKDLNPSGAAVISNFTTTRDGIYFLVRNNNFTSWTLYKSDGTETGTVEVAVLGDFAPQALSLIKASDSTIYICGASVGSGKLYLSDGTTAGTRLIYQTAHSIFFPRPRSINGTTIFFERETNSVNDFSKTRMLLVNGDNIHTVDGNIAPYAAYTGVYDTLDNQFLFAAADDAHGTELWSYRVRSPQTITFPTLTSEQLTAYPVILGASASSGLPVSYVSSDPSVASVSGDQLLVFGTGTVTITAGQAGDNYYEPAVPVSQTVTITPAVLSVAGKAPPVLYPNPGSGIFHIAFGAARGPANYTVWNGQGQQVVNGQVPASANGQLSVNLSLLQSGLYFIQLKYKDGSSTVLKALKIQ